MSSSPSVSVIITSHNEGAELYRTLQSVTDNTQHLAEVIVVDDGSTDGSCENIDRTKVRVVRHTERLGVAVSRDAGSRAASGDVLCYLDGHQRIGKSCLDHCARVAIERNAITCPDIKGYSFFGWRLHGAEFRLCPQRGYFSGRWNQGFALGGVRPVSGLCAPPYLVPRQLYERVAWSRSLHGWGASEASIVIKSFFVGLPILHVAGPLARHRFRSEFPYATTWDGVWRNHAVIARICFDDATWFRYWLPEVFEPHLTDENRAVVESDEIQAEHDAFQAWKARNDRQFWTDLLNSSPPAGCA